MPRKTAAPAPPKHRTLAPFARHIKDLKPASMEEETRLLAAAQRVKALAPWETLTEDDFFAVQNPENQDFGFVSILGALGELRGVVLYRDVDAFFGLQRVREALELDPEPSFESGLQLLQISQLQARFETKADLGDEDLALLKRHKIKVTARGLYPQFISIRPGYLPWLVDGEEVRFLAIALEQLAEVFDRRNFESGEFEVRGRVRRGVGIFELFVREQTPDGDWIDGRREFLPPAPVMFELPLDDDILAKIAAKPYAKKPVELAITVMPLPFAQSGERPFLPGAMVMMQNDEVVGQTITSQGYSTAAIPEIVVSALEALAKALTKPREIWVSEPRLLVLASFESVLGIKVVLKEELPTADKAIHEMINFVMGSRFGAMPPAMPGAGPLGSGGFTLH